MMARVRAEKLIGDVRENGGALRWDAGLGDQSEQAGKKLAEIDSGRELVELGEEVGGEIFRFVIQLQESGGLGRAGRRTCEQNPGGKEHMTAFWRILAYTYIPI